MTNATSVELKNGTVNQAYNLGTNFTTINGTTFNYGLKYATNALKDVEVKGLFENTASGTLTLTGVTLNKVKAASLTEIVVKGVTTLNSDGTVNSYTVKTTTFGDSMTDGTDPLNLTNGLTIEHDAVLNVLNDVTIKVTGLIIEGAETAGSAGKSSKGVLNQYGTITVTGTTSNAGEWNK